jgi:DNA polymerase-1
VAGIGEKSAAELLQQFGSLDKIYKNLDKVATRYRNKLEAGKDVAYLSRQLSAIVTDVDIEFDLEACVAPGLTGDTLNFDRERVAELFRVLEFRSLLGRRGCARRRSSGCRSARRTAKHVRPRTEDSAPASTRPRTAVLRKGGPFSTGGQAVSTRAVIVDTPEALVAGGRAEQGHRDFRRRNHYRSAAAELWALRSRWRAMILRPGGHARS